MSSDALEKLPRARQAAFNHSSMEHNSGCLPGTRVDVIKKVRAWALSDDKSCIFWLSGSAGAGKSTIAHTLCTEFEKEGRLGASFFFSRDEDERSRATLFFPTLAWQLAHSQPAAVRKVLQDESNERPHIADLIWIEQWKTLIAKPLQQRQGGIVVIIIDALDECSADADVKRLISVLVQARDISSCSVRIVITSRPEVAIRQPMNDSEIVQYQLPLRLQDEPDDVVDADICLYFYDQFARIKRDREFPLDMWPSIDTINKLVHQAQRLFIYAATVCKFVGQYESVTPDEALLFLFSERTDLRNVYEEEGLGSLDALYTEVLHQAAKAGQSTRQRRLCDLQREVVGVITTLEDPLPISALAEISGLHIVAIRNGLRRLHSVIRVPADDGTPVRLYHPSFRDFIQDRRRCVDQDFYIDPTDFHAMLSSSCLNIMRGQIGIGLTRDILNLVKPGTRRSEVSNTTIRKSIRPALSYAISYWTVHVMKGNIAIKDHGEVDNFLQEHLSHWMEGLCWLGQLSSAVRQIIQLQARVKVCTF